MKRSYREYLGSEAWKEKRREVLDRAVGMCDRCGVNPATQVHHVHYRTVFAEDTTDGTLAAYCFGCHEFVHGKTDLDPKSFGEDWCSYYQAILGRI